MFAVTGTDYSAPQSPPQSSKTYPQNGLLADSSRTSAMTSLSVHYELAVPSVCSAGTTAPDKSVKSPNACPMHSIPRCKNSEMFGCTWFNEIKVRNTISLGPLTGDRTGHSIGCGIADYLSDQPQLAVAKFTAHEYHSFPLLLCLSHEGS